MFKLPSRPRVCNCSIYYGLEVYSLAKWYTFGNPCMYLSVTKPKVVICGLNII